MSVDNQTSYLAVAARWSYLSISVSLIVLLAWWLSHSAPVLLPLLLLSYGLWGWTVRMYYRSSIETQNKNSVEDEVCGHGEAVDLVQGYYRHLYLSLDRSWELFSSDYDQSQHTLERIGSSLSQAMELAKGTGMSAVNAMMASAKTGEVGRGFVTVSKDMVKLSEQSSADLRRLRQIVSRTEVLLKHYQLIPIREPKSYMNSGDFFPCVELVDLLINLRRSQKEMRILTERYQRQRKHDVRWMQLADAVRRLLNDLLNTLYQLELRIGDVLADVRLWQLSGTLEPQQLSEIKDGIGLSSKLVEPV